MINDTEKSSLNKTAPRLWQIMLVLTRHKFLRSLFGKRKLPPPKEVRETFEELGVVFIKFGQVLPFGSGADTCIGETGRGSKP